MQPLSSERRSTGTLEQTLMKHYIGMYSPYCDHKYPIPHLPWLPSRWKLPSAQNRWLSQINIQNKSLTRLTLSAVKMAKSILSNDRDNLVLWDGYARLERQRGNIAAARTVYITALQAAHVQPTQQMSAWQRMNEDETELWSGWAEMEWETGDEARCFEVLVMAAAMEASTLGMLALFPQYGMLLTTT